MVLPLTISSTDVALQNSYYGPFKSSAGAFYTILLDSTNLDIVEAHKATDPEVAFTEQDSGNQPDFVNDILTMNVWQEGDDLHVVAQTSILEVYYARFEMASDTWATPDATNQEELIDNNADGTAQSCDILVLSTGKIRTVFQGAVDMDMGSDFNRTDESNSVDGGATWSAPTQIDDGVAAVRFFYIGPRMVLPPNNSDQCFVLMDKVAATPGEIGLRGIAEDNTLRTYRNSGILVNFASTSNFTHSIGFLRNGVSLVRFGYVQTATLDLEVYEFNAYSDDTDVTAVDSLTNVSTENVQGTTGGFDGSIIACLAVDGSTIRGLMVKAANDDSFEFDDANSDTYTLQGTAHLVGTVNHVSCNIYSRSGLKLGVIYNDGAVKYDEVDISYVFANLADVTFPDQNSVVGPFEI